MARSLFGGRIGDSVVSLFALGRRQLLTLPIDANGDPTSTTLQVWSGPEDDGGVRYLDLVQADGTTATSVVVVPSTGQVPAFYGPDGVNVDVWVRDPDGDFFRMDVRADAAAEAAAAAQAAAEAAAADAEAAKDAAEAVGTTNDGVMAGVAANPASAFAVQLSNTFVLRGAILIPSVDSDDITDRDKLQDVIDQWVAGGYGQDIWLDRQYDVTGGAPISIDKVNWYDREELRFVGPGGITKNDSGIVFTSATANTGDVSFLGVRFISTPGVGATLLDGNKLIRISTTDNQWRDWDALVNQTTSGRVLQQYVMKGDRIIGGAGAFVRARESYACDFDVTVEDRDASAEHAMFFENTEALATIANRELNIRGTIQNCDRVPVKLGMTWPGALEKLYLEANGAATDPQIDLWTLNNTGGFQTGLKIENLQIQQTLAQKAARVGAILVGANATDAPIISIGNVADGGIMYQFAHASGMVEGHGDRVESGGRVTYPGHEHQYFTTGGRSTTTAARPKNPRIGKDVYFDTDLTKLIVPVTAGSKSTAGALVISAGATSSGNVTIKLAGIDYLVAVTAGDSITQVRDKIVAAGNAVFYPTWKLTASSTNTIAIESFAPGSQSGTTSFNGGATGVTSSFIGTGAGSNPAWAEMTRVLSAQTTLDFPSIAAGGQQELDVTVTGTAFGDGIALSPPALNAGLSVSAYVSATNTVRVRLVNNTASAIDPASASWVVKVLK